MKQNKLLLKYILGMCFMMLFSMTSFGQNSVTGVVTSGEDNQGLPGVNILVKGSTNGTVTDIDGTYTISNVQQGESLIFSFIGYKSQEVAVGSQSKIDVSLEVDAEQLQEVVVIGYGTANKSDLTGSISSISSKDFENQPIIRAEEALQGRAAGVQVLKSSGAAGGDIKIRIRGSNSITGNNSPLIVIDGIVGGDLGSLNSSDIESINILKDASASAIYGSRGANGVVLVTTRKGGEPSIDVNYFITASSVPKKIDIMSGQQFSDEYKDGTLSNGGADYQDEYFQNGLTNNLQLSASGKEGKLSYLISGNYVDQIGIIHNTDYNRLSIRTNLSAELSKKLTVGLNLYGSRENAHNLVQGGTRGTRDSRGGINNVLSFDPSLAVRDEDGNYNYQSGDGSILVNPIAVQNESDGNLVEDRYNANLNIAYEIIENLKFTVLGGASILHSNNEAYFGLPSGSAVQSPEARFTSRRGTDLQLSNILNWKKNLGSVDLNLTGIYELQSADSKIFNGTSLNYAIPGKQNAFHLLEIGQAQSITSTELKSTMQSYVGRAEVSVADQLLVTATLRVDESSKFREGKRVGYFPSVSAGYNLGQFLPEDFFIENIKVRAGYGETGNQNIPAYSTYRSIPSGARYNYFFNGTSATNVGLGHASFADENLTWETTKQFNVGLDFTFLAGRIELNADWYKKNTTDLLIDLPIPRFSGGGALRTNLGEVENSGIDLSLSAFVVDNNDFKWNASFVFTKVTNSVVNLGGMERILKKAFDPSRPTSDGIKPGGSDDNYYILEPGQPLGNFYGATYTGVDPATGEATYAQSADGSGNQLGVIGNGMPDFTWGFNNTLTYKGFDMNIFVRGVQGYDIFNATRGLISLGGGDVRDATAAESLNRWSETNTTSDIPSGGANVIASSRYIEDGSFIRLSNISIGYTIPASNWFNSIKFYVSGQNLLTITDYKGYDPEVSSTGATTDDSTPSFDFGALPNPRSFTVGMNLNF